MGFFGGTDESVDNQATTIITHGTTIKGELKSTGRLYIDGEFEGHIYSDGKVTIGKKGIVRGEIFSDEITVQGKLNAQIDVNILRIHSTGHVVGKVVANEMMIEPYGTFEGESRKKIKDDKVKLNKPKEIDLHEKNKTEWSFWIFTKR